MWAIITRIRDAVMRGMRQRHTLGGVGYPPGQKVKLRPNQSASALIDRENTRDEASALCSNSTCGYVTVLVLGSVRKLSRIITFQIGCIVAQFAKYSCAALTNPRISPSRAACTVYGVRAPSENLSTRVRPIHLPSRTPRENVPPQRKICVLSNHSVVMRDDSLANCQHCSHAFRQVAPHGMTFAQ